MMLVIVMVENVFSGLGRFSSPHLMLCTIFFCLKKRNIKHRYSLVCCVIPLAIFGHLNTLTPAKSGQVVTVSVNVSRRVRAGGTKQNEMKRDSMEMFMSFRSR